MADEVEIMLTNLIKGKSHTGVYRFPTTTSIIITDVMKILLMIASFSFINSLFMYGIVRLLLILIVFIFVISIPYLRSIPGLQNIRLERNRPTPISIIVQGILTYISLVLLFIFLNYDALDALFKGK